MGRLSLIPLIAVVLTLSLLVTFVNSQSPDTEPWRLKLVGKRVVEGPVKYSAKEVGEWDT